MEKVKEESIAKFDVIERNMSLNIIKLKEIYNKELKHIFSFLFNSLRLLFDIKRLYMRNKK